MAFIIASKPEDASGPRLKLNVVNAIMHSRRLLHPNALATITIYRVCKQRVHRVT